MADRPILFSAPMVQALLDGRKTQTRRTIKPRGHFSLFDGSWTDDYVLDPGNVDWRAQDVRFSIGDRLWVKETFFPRPGLPERSARPRYRADEDRPEWRGLWKPSIFMPRWASRLTLTVTDVRVQRLQDCSEEDAIAEGGISEQHSNDPYPTETIWHHGQALLEFPGFTTPIGSYRHLWNSINGAGSWEANPWVAAVSFDVHRSNIDRLNSLTNDEGQVRHG